jgi:amidase
MSALPYVSRVDRLTNQDQPASLLRFSPAGHGNAVPRSANEGPIPGLESATAMLNALRARDLSADELVASHARRIAAYGASLNAFASLLPDARAGAKAADAARARGYASILSGLPLTLEQAVYGRAQPAPHFMRKAGATILGFTHGRPRNRDGAAGRGSDHVLNPWDREHWAGPVSSAAAVAAGLSPLAFGSDSSGQARVAASYCGVFAHRPSRPANSRLRQAASAYPDLFGITARAAEDLELGVQLLGTVTTGTAASWWLQARPRHATLAGFRVALVAAPDDLPVDSEIADAYDAFLADLRAAGVSVNVLPQSISSAFYTRPEGRTTPDRADPAKRRETRPLLKELFKDWDVLLAPATATPAPRLGDAADFQNSVGRAFMPMAHDVASGHPLTVFPIGLTRRFLPIGCTLIGPYLEDRTSIRFAALVQEEFGGYHRPFGYAGAG